MKRLILICFFLSALSVSYGQTKPTEALLKMDPDDTPFPFVGNFIDDYGIKYTINDTLWIQQPSIRFHIIKWSIKDQYLIARNDDKNPGDGGLYTRIDYMQLANTDSWQWGYCLSAYNAKSDAYAEKTAIANRENPKTGCNGYPFSRMKKVK